MQYVRAIRNSVLHCSWIWYSAPSTGYFSIRNSCHPKYSMVSSKAEWILNLCTHLKLNKASLNDTNTLAAQSWLWTWIMNWTGWHNLKIICFLTPNWYSDHAWFKRNALDKSKTKLFKKGKNESKSYCSCKVQSPLNVV